MVAPFRHINREELYELIWQKPMREVGEELGLHALRVGHLCKRLNVPTPPPGYWSRFRSGKGVAQAPPLPVIQRGELRSAKIRRTDGKSWTVEELRDRAALSRARDEARAAAAKDAQFATARRSALADLSRRSDEAERLRRFLARLEAMAPTPKCQEPPEWLSWIRAEIDRIDPLMGGIERVIAALGTVPEEG